MITRRVQLAVGTSVIAALMAFAGPVKAAPESVQKQCGDEWAAAKKAGKVAPGQAWPGFLSECRKRHAADTTTPATPAKAEKAEKAAAKADKADKAAAKTDKAAAPAPAPAPAPTTAAAGDINETCKSEYSAGKTSGAVPKGTNYFKYLSECKKRHAGDAAPATKTAAPAAPAKPDKTAAAPAKADTKAPATGGREAMYERERTCGAKWKTIKGTASLPAGITTWPKYWSYCNARLKAGQAI